MPIQAVLFDHDGTLVDSEIIHYRLWRTLLRGLGIDLAQSVYQRHYAGVPGDDNARDMVLRFALPHAPSWLYQAKERATQAWLQQRPFPLMPGAEAMLRACRQHGLDLALVTGANRHGVAASQRAFPCFSLFASVVSREDIASSKPAPDGYELALEQLELRPEDCVAIEDSEAGVRAAVAAGLRCLAIPTVLSAGQDFSQATACCRDLAAAWEWLAAHG